MTTLEVFGAVCLFAMVVVAFIGGVFGDDKVIGDKDDENLDL